MKNYFCIENIAKKKINILEITGKNVEYSFDTVNWIALNKQVLKFNKRKLYLRSTSVSHINCKTYFNVSGNIMSLIYGDKFTGNETTFNNSACFYRLFANNYGSTSYLLDASNLILPVTTLTDRCYAGMFYNCTSLIKAPQLLPATTLDEYCYSNMFRDCTSLTEAPELPAATLAGNCYQSMFRGCTSLNNITITINTTQSWDKHNTLNWLENVSAHGIIYNKGKVKDIPLNSNSGCPQGWTIKEID